MRAIGNKRNTPEPKESEYRGFLLIPVGYGQHKRYIIATLDRKFVTGLRVGCSFDSPPIPPGRCL